ncbi:hypothetical protein AOLI_G00123420 [Acnodon oligacanthus]
MVWPHSYQECHRPQAQCSHGQRTASPLLTPHTTTTTTKPFPSLPQPLLGHSGLPSAAIWSEEGEEIGPAAKALFSARRWRGLSARRSKRRCRFCSGISDSIYSSPGAERERKTEGGIIREG